MCGLFGYIGKEKSLPQLVPYFERIQHRGPDYSEIRAVSPEVTLGFHRLAINGLNPQSNQPMYLEGCWLAANAEVYNFRELAERYHIELQTDSDCEIIIHLYRRLGLEGMVQELDAEFAFLLYDERTATLFAARDHLGVRGFYIGRATDSNDLGFASEAKALTFLDEIQQFPTGCWWASDAPNSFRRHYKHQYAQQDQEEGAEMYATIRRLLREAVEKRLMSDRPVGCLLSGGLDSSLVAALAQRHRKTEAPLETFSIGMEGSPDLERAAEVAQFIGTKHHHVQLEEADFLAALEETIYTCGSYDITTIRASVGHLLISRYVREHSDVKVLFTGETIDEMGSYLYFQNAPDDTAFQEEATRLLKDIHYFDMLRGDRCISSAGLEARVPFSDKAFVHYYMSIPAKYRMFGAARIEKHPLRQAFAEEGLLPDSVLWRRKNGFSDSVSDKQRSWSVIIQEYVDLIVSEEEFQTAATQYPHCPPTSKEAYYYRQKFHEFYGAQAQLTPYFWLPKWCGTVTDPSARVLSIYEAD